MTFHVYICEKEKMWELNVMSENVAIEIDLVVEFSFWFVGSAIKSIFEHFFLFLFFAKDDLGIVSITVVISVSYVNSLFLLLRDKEKTPIMERHYTLTSSTFCEKTSI